MVHVYLNGILYPLNQNSKDMTVCSFLSHNERADGLNFCSKPKSKWPVKPDFVWSELDTDPNVKQSTCNTIAFS